MAFDYYQNVYRVLFEIDSNKEILNSYISERQHLIDICEPSDYKSLNYEEPKVQSMSNKPGDEQIMERINELTVYIVKYEAIIAEKESTLERLTYLGKKTLKKLEERNRENLKLKVFIATFLEGKTIAELKEEIPGYEMQTFWNVKTELNAMMREESSIKPSSN